MQFIAAMPGLGGGEKETRGEGEEKRTEEAVFVPACQAAVFSLSEGGKNLQKRKGGGEGVWRPFHLRLLTLLISLRRVGKGEGNREKEEGKRQIPFLFLFITREGGRKGKKKEARRESYFNSVISL